MAQTIMINRGGAHNSKENTTLVIQRARAYNGLPRVRLRVRDGKCDRWRDESVWTGTDGRGPSACRGHV